MHYVVGCQGKKKTKKRHTANQVNDERCHYPHISIEKRGVDTRKATQISVAGSPKVKIKIFIEIFCKKSRQHLCLANKRTFRSFLPLRFVVNRRLSTAA